MQEKLLPVLSIITVVRNDPKRLLRTILGVSKYKTSLTEYIVIDGDSTDETPLVIQSNIGVIDHYISEPDAGIYDAMNKGISIATGKYLLFLNAGDDLVEDLEKIVMSLRSTTFMAYGKANMIGGDGKVRYVKGKKIRRPSSFLKGMPLCHQAILYKRDLMERYDLRFSVMSDRVLTYQLITKHGLLNTEFVDRIFVNYYDGGFSCSVSPWALYKEQNLFYINVNKKHFILIKFINYIFKQKIKLPFLRLALSFQK